MFDLRRGVSRRPEGSALSWSGQRWIKGEILPTIFSGVSRSTRVGSCGGKLCGAPFDIFSVSWGACMVFTLPDGRIKMAELPRLQKTTWVRNKDKKGGQGRSTERTRTRSVFRVQTRDWRAAGGQVLIVGAPVQADGQGKKQDQKSTCPRVHGRVRGT